MCSNNWNVKILMRDKCSTFMGITFDKSSDALMVWKEGVWQYNGGFLLVMDWPISGDWKDAKLDRVPCWVRVYDFPRLALNKTNVTRIGKLAGEILENTWSNVERILLNGFSRLKINFPVDNGIFLG